MKTALITGAAGGMGLAAAERLLQGGWAVWGLDIRAPEPLPEGLRFVQCDLTRDASVQAAFLRLQEESVRLDAVLHMAGLYDLDSLVEISQDDWDRIFQVNLYGPYRVNKTFLPLLTPGARLLITTSELAPLNPLPFTGIYAVTKAALDRYAASLRMELQLLDISVIVLRPGAVDTRLLDVSTDRLEAFCAKTTHYAPNAERFRRIVRGVEARKIPPRQIAALAEKALLARHPRDVYAINRNPLLLALNVLPQSMQRRIIRHILK